MYNAVHFFARENFFPSFDVFRVAPVSVVSTSATARVGKEHPLMSASIASSAAISARHALAGKRVRARTVR